MEFQKFSPPSFLADHVLYFWTLEILNDTSLDFFFRGFASRYPRLIFQHHQGNSAISINGEQLPFLYLGGLNSKPYDLTVNPSMSMTGAVLYPQTLRTLFRTDSHEFLDQLPHFEFASTTELANRMLDTKTPRERIALLIDWLMAKIPSQRLEDRFFNKGFQILEARPQDFTVGQLAHFFNFSERQLQRKFKANFGHTPLQFLRIKRFEKSLQYIRSKDYNGSWKLSDLAYDLNYVDQSHFIRDFKRFSKHTPMEFIDLDRSTQENSALYYQDRG